MVNKKQRNMIQHGKPQKIQRIPYNKYDIKKYPLGRNSYIILLAPSLSTHSVMIQIEHAIR